MLGSRPFTYYVIKFCILPPTVLLRESKSHGYFEYFFNNRFFLLQIAAEVSAPLSRVDEIVLLGGDNDRTTSEVTKLLAEMPPAVQALTGVDLSKVRTLLYLFILACPTSVKRFRPFVDVMIAEHCSVV